METKLVNVNTTLTGRIRKNGHDFYESIREQMNFSFELERLVHNHSDRLNAIEVTYISQKTLTPMLFLKTQREQHTTQHEPSTVAGEAEDDENVSNDDVDYGEYPYDNISYLDGSRD